MYEELQSLQYQSSAPIQNHSAQVSVERSYCLVLGLDSLARRVEVCPVHCYYDSKYTDDHDARVVSELSSSDYVGNSGFVLLNDDLESEYVLNRSNSGEFGITTLKTRSNDRSGGELTKHYFGLRFTA